MADWSVLKNKTTTFEEDKDFNEEDVWGDFASKKIKRVSKDSFGSCSSTSARKNIPKASALSAVVSDDPFVRGSSAPINIPDWSKVYGKNCKNNGLHGYGDDYGDDGDDDEDGDVVPPHEWIAKKLARNQISSFSVCEGIGRTLKGRDLSKVRNAILTKTGFIE